MAAPTVRGFGTPTNNVDAAPAFTVNQPASVAAGDLLLAFAANDTTGTAWTVSPGNGWVQLSDEVQGATHRLAVYAKIADGTDTLSIAAANNNDASCVMMAIEAGTHGVSDVTTDIVIPAAATATTGNANPPASGTVAAQDWRAIAACACDFTATGDAISAAPTNYTTGAVLTKSAASTSSVGLGVGHRALTAATSEDPGTFTNTSRPWIAKTLLVPPPGAASPATVTPAAVAVTTTLPTPSPLAAVILAVSVLTNTVTLPTPTIDVPPQYTNLLVVELDNAGDPGTDLDHYLRTNARTDAGTGFIRVRLFQDTTEIAGYEFQPTGSFVTYEYALLEAEAAAITDYTDLQLHIEVKATSSPFTPQIDWVAFVHPAGATVVTPAAIAPTLALPTPTIDVSGGAVSVSPTAIAVTLTLPTPVAQGAASVTPAAIAPTVTLPLSTAQGAVRVTPSAVAPTVSLSTPAILAAVRVTPAAIVPTVTLPIPTTITGAGTTAAPDAIALTVTLPTPTASIPALVSPAAIAVTLSLPTPVAQGQARTTPSAVAPTVSLPTPTVIAGAGTTATPAAITPTVSLPIPAILALARVTPAAVVPIVSLPNPTAGVSATRTPAAIVPTVSLPTPTILTGATVTPAAIALTVTLPTPSRIAGSVVTPAAITLTITFPPPTATVGIVPFWIYSPAAYTTNPAAYTLAPAGYDPISGSDDSPWD